MSEEKKDDNAIEDLAIDDFLKYSKTPYGDQECQAMFEGIAQTINILNNKLKSMQVDIDKLKAPKVSVDDSTSDSDELDNKPEHCCQIS